MRDANLMGKDVSLSPERKRLLGRVMLLCGVSSAAAKAADNCRRDLQGVWRHAWV